MLAPSFSPSAGSLKLPRARASASLRNQSYPCWHGLARMPHHEHALELHFRHELFQHRQQHIVHDQETVLRVVGDLGDFVRMQAQVQRMQHAARGGNAEVASRCA